MMQALLRNVGRRTIATARLLSAPAATEQKSVSKEAMLKLRKSTGYSFVNCRKALLKFGEDNMGAAEEYLKEMAVKEGWAKAAKVGNRETSQGQCGIAADRNMATVVELKCETDFVGRSAPFKELVSEIALSILDYAKNQKNIVCSPLDDSELRSVHIDAKNLKLSTGKTVEEAITSVIGQLGENITFENAYLLISHDDVVVYGFSHPQERVGNVEIGRFVAAIGVKRTDTHTAFSTEKLASQLCQHIIGMNPTSLGSTESVQAVATPADESKPVNTNEPSPAGSLDDELNAFSNVESTSMDENETALLRQSFMLNPNQTVSDYLDTHGCEVLDFWRFELGKLDKK